MVVASAAAVLTHLLMRELVIVTVVTGTRAIAAVVAVITILASAKPVGTEPMVAAIVSAIVHAELPEVVLDQEVKGLVVARSLFSGGASPTVDHHQAVVLVEDCCVPRSLRGMVPLELQRQIAAVVVAIATPVPARPLSARLRNHHRLGVPSCLPV